MSRNVYVGYTKKLDSNLKATSAHEAETLVLVDFEGLEPSRAFCQRLARLYIDASRHAPRCQACTKWPQLLSQTNGADTSPIPTQGEKV